MALCHPLRNGILIAPFSEQIARTIFSLLVSSGPRSAQKERILATKQSWADGDNKRIKSMAILRTQDRSDRIVPERTERVYDSGGLWYFRTRDRGSIGPFRYQSEAR